MDGAIEKYSVGNLQCGAWSPGPLQSAKHSLHSVLSQSVELGNTALMACPQRTEHGSTNLSAEDLHRVWSSTKCGGCSATCETKQN